MPGHLARGRRLGDDYAADDGLDAGGSAERIEHGSPPVAELDEFGIALFKGSREPAHRFVRSMPPGQRRGRARPATVGRPPRGRRLVQDYAAEDSSGAVSTTGMISMVPSVNVKCGQVFERVWMALMLFPCRMQYPPTKLA